MPPLVVDEPPVADQLLDVRPGQPRPVGHEPVDAADDLALGDREPSRARGDGRLRRLGLDAALEVLVAVELALLGRRVVDRAPGRQSSGAQSPIAGNTAIATSSTIAVEIAASATLYV